jgi:hypothetical protein
MLLRSAPRDKPQEKGALPEPATFAPAAEEMIANL